MRSCVTRRVEDIGELLESLRAGRGDVDSSPRAHERMQMAYACENAHGELEVVYVVSGPALSPYVVWRVTPVDGHLASLAREIPLLGWYEREIHDLYGVCFDDSPDEGALVVHEGASPVVPPMLRSYPNSEIMPTVSAGPIIPDIIGEELQRLPFGPIRADVVESAQFLFFYIGEGILHYIPRLFYKHRGMEKRFEGVGLDHGVVLAERVSGVDSFAHALAFSIACESALGLQPPIRAQYLRVVMAELERLYNHLHYFGELAKMTTLKVADAQGHYLEECVKQLNARLTGSRFLRGVVRVGGMHADYDLSWLGVALKSLSGEIEDYLKRLEETRSHYDRLATTGVLTAQVAFDQGATGPVERASGLDRDLRRDHPYAVYELLHLDVPVQEAGDAHARSLVRMAETRASLACVFEALERIEPGPVWSDEVGDPDPDGAGLGWVEGTRGGLLYAVHLDGLRCTRVKIKDPSFSNWRVFPFTVHDTNMMDYAINEASFGLSIAGVDR
ncbi:MAG: hydrogenase large subunit [Ferrimicrobium sp.]